MYQYVNTYRQKDDICICNHFSNLVWNINFEKNNTVSSKVGLIIFKTDGVQTVETFKSLLKKEYEAGHPVTVWCVRPTPATERIYIGPLKSTPHLTTLTMEGDYPPEVTATAMVSK